MTKLVKTLVGSSRHPKRHETFHSRGWKIAAPPGILVVKDFVEFQPSAAPDRLPLPHRPSALDLQTK